MRGKGCNISVRVCLYAERRDLLLQGMDDGGQQLGLQSLLQVPLLSLRPNARHPMNMLMKGAVQTVPHARY